MLGWHLHLGVSELPLFAQLVLDFAGQAFAALMRWMNLDRECSRRLETDGFQMVAMRGCSRNE